MLRLVVLSLVAITLLTAAEPPAAVDASRPVDVPDPIGLGERLALIDWLQERKLAVADRDDLPALRLAYLKAAKPALFSDPEAGEKEAVALDLWQRHGVNADRKEPLAALKAMLADLDQRKGASDTAELQRQQALSGTGPRSPAATKPAAARPAAPVAPPAPGRGAEVAAAPRPAAPAAPPAQAPVATIDEAPWAEFRDLVWYVEAPGGGHYWKTGDGSELYPAGMGRIDQKGLIGPQHIVWQNTSYEITGCIKQDANLWLVTFARGTLRMSDQGKRRWECQFTPTNSSITRTFRTGGTW